MDGRSSSDGALVTVMQGDKVDLFGVGISVTDYDAAVGEIMAAGRSRRSFGVSALATHGLVTAKEDPELLSLVNTIDMVTPDGQPVRWAVNLLYRAGLKDRVYGPDLTRLVCAAAAREGVGIYLFGSTPETCQTMVRRLRDTHPDIRIVGVQPDRFREATPQEDAEDVDRINASGAGIVLVGRGCPRQERWVAQHLGRVEAAMLAVGAAFDYIAGNHPVPPPWMQRVGLEWAFRLWLEPRRLFRRYLVYNTKFMALLARAWFGRRVALSASSR